MARVNSHESTFSALLRALRTGADLTQEALAERCGLSIRTIRNLELGTVARPQGRSLGLLADAFGLEGRRRAAFVAHAPRVTAVNGELLTELGQGRCWLPPPGPPLIGRAACVAELIGSLRLGGEADGSPAVVLVAGPAGAGKTAIGLAAAHAVRPDFPDGQVYIELAQTPDPVDGVRDCLGELLRFLGPEGADIAGSLAERQRSYQELTAGRRLLVVLDSVMAESQLRALLPSSDTAAVVVLSSGRLPAFRASRRVDVTELDPDSAAELLIRSAGRAPDDDRSVAAIVERCERLPLALAIVGGMLAARPYLGYGQFAARLAAEDTRLDELAAGDLSLRNAIGRSYAAAGPRARRLSRLLSTLDVDEFSERLCAIVLRQPRSATRSALEELCDWHLLSVASRRPTATSGYRMSALTRTYLRERARQEECLDELRATGQRIRRQHTSEDCPVGATADAGRPGDRPLRSV
jgi:transcriptional regulator with XRE-family HTH domain